LGKRSDRMAISRESVDSLACEISSRESFGTLALNSVSTSDGSLTDIAQLNADGGTSPQSG